MNEQQVQVEETADFIAAYKHYLLEHEKRPTTVYRFARAENFEEAQFYKSYTSLKALEEQVWVSLLNQTIERLMRSSDYQSFTAREKLLALYFTWAETLKANASFVRLALASSSGPLADLPIMPPSYILAMKAGFVSYCGDILTEAIAGGEVEDRPYIASKYQDALWFQFLSLMLVWLKDTSVN